MIHDAELAHELRTPLHGVLAAVELLGATALSAEQRGHVETIREAADALLALANDTLGTDAERGVATSDVRRVVDGVRRLLEPAARRDGIALDARVDADVPRAARAPAGPLRQVLVNLVGNALKHGRTVHVHVRRATDESIAFVVRDDGPGMDDATRAGLFAPTVPSERSSAHGGAGLGLAIAASLVRRMGGEIGVRSTPGDGAEFWFTVPAWDDGEGLDGGTCVGGTIAAGTSAACVPPSYIPREHVPPPHVPREHVPPANATRSPASHALVLDDDPVGLKVTTQLLSHLGLHVTGVATVADARGALGTTRFDAVFLDAQLPDGDGFALASDARAAGVAHVVALTASADAGTRDRALRAGADACCVKPVGLDTLRAALAGSTSADPAIDAERIATLAALEADAPGLVASIADSYARSAVERLAALRHAATAANTAAVRAAAHALRGASADAGAARAAALAAEIERQATSGAAPDDDALDALSAAVDAASSALHAVETAR